MANGLICVFFDALPHSSISVFGVLCTAFLRIRIIKKSERGGNRSMVAAITDSAERLYRPNIYEFVVILNRYIHICLRLWSWHSSGLKKSLQSDTFSSNVIKRIRKRIAGNIHTHVYDIPWLNCLVCLEKFRIRITMLRWHIDWVKVLAYLFFPNNDALYAWNWSVATHSRRYYSEFE